MPFHLAELFTRGSKQVVEVDLVFVFGGLGHKKKRKGISTIMAETVDGCYDDDGGDGDDKRNTRIASHRIALHFTHLAILFLQCIRANIGHVNVRRKGLRSAEQIDSTTRRLLIQTIPVPDFHRHEFVGVGVSGGKTVRSVGVYNNNNKAITS